MEGIFLVPFAPFLFVLGIIWLNNQRKLEEKRIAAGAATPDGEGKAALERVGELEDRVRVLERIVTDGGYDLAHKIEALRDERGVDERIGTAQPAEMLERLR